MGRANLLTEWLRGIRGRPAPACSVVHAAHLKQHACHRPVAPIEDNPPAKSGDFIRPIKGVPCPPPSQCEILVSISNGDDIVRGSPDPALRPTKGLPPPLCVACAARLAAPTVVCAGLRVVRGSPDPAQAAPLTSRREAARRESSGPLPRAVESRRISPPPEDFAAQATTRRTPPPTPAANNSAAARA